MSQDSRRFVLEEMPTPMFGLVRAPEIARDGLQWLNVAEPLSLRSLRGRIVILDFWTYCCVNCMHVLPTLRRIEEAYPQSVAVVGVHSPKFPCERDLENLRQAVARYDIRHPVIHDPLMVLWDEYAVKAWPTLVLISPGGYVIGQLAGEPDPDRLVDGIGMMAKDFQTRGELDPAGLPVTVAPESKHRLRYPGKIKPLPGGGIACWAVADAGHHQIVLFSDDGREIDRFGSGEAGQRDGAPEEVRFNSPQGLVATEGHIYVADTGNHALRAIDLSDGTVTTLAGLGFRGMPLKAARRGDETALASPWDLDIDTAAGILFFTNAGTHQICTFDLEDDEIAPLTGTGGENLVDGPCAEALLAQPSGLAWDARTGTLWFVDSETSALRAVRLKGEARVETLIGRGLFSFGAQDGPASRASLQHPLGLTLWNGEIIIADSYNHALRRYDPQRDTVETLPLHTACADGACRRAGEPAGVSAAGPDRLLVSDTNNHRIVEVTPSTGAIRQWST